MRPLDLSLPLLLLLVGAFQVAFGGQSGTRGLGQSNLGPAKLLTNCTRPNLAALTFDDGPYIYERDLIDTLNKARVKATFFVNGDLYDCIYKQEYVDSMRYALATGHQIGSHTWKHLDLTSLNETQIASEIKRTDDALRKILGISPHFIRPPFLAVNDLVRQVAGQFRTTLINVNFDSQDWTGATADTILERFQDIAEEHPDSIASLGHEPLQTTVYGVVEESIQILRKAGYRFVTVSECTGINPYNWVGFPRRRDNSWVCDAE